MSHAITASKLTKYYRQGRVLGVKNLDLAVKSGEIFGFLGPNGAGKSTTIRLLLDLIRPTSGEASILGMDVRKESVKIRQQIGYLPGEIFLPPTLTGQQCLRFFLRYKNQIDHKYLRHLIDRLELDLKKKIETYSKGNRQKLAIVLALMHKPALLLLDEPTSGLDPLNQQVFYELIKETTNWGTTVFFSTHILSEANLLCDRVGIIKQGKLVTVEDIDALRERNIRYVTLFSPNKLLKKSLQGSEVKEIELTPNGARLTTVGPLGALIKRLAKLEIEDFSVSEPSLEDLFMKYYT